jgi:hypothetical protein
MKAKAAIRAKAEKRARKQKKGLLNRSSSRGKGRGSKRAEAILDRLPPDTFGLAASAQLKQGLAPLLYRRLCEALRGSAGESGEGDKHAEMYAFVRLLK